MARSTTASTRCRPTSARSTTWRSKRRKSGGEEILSVLQRDMGVTGAHIKATFREIVVNGKTYDSVDAMPPDVRRTYEQAMARTKAPVVSADRKSTRLNSSH